MKQTRTRILTLLLALAMCLSLLPATALAAEGEASEPPVSVEPISENEGPYTITFYVPLTSGGFQTPITRQTTNVNGKNLLLDWPEDPVREGNNGYESVFAGWSRMNTNLKSLFPIVSTDENFTEDTDLYAAFDLFFVLNLNANGGTCNVEKLLLTDGVLKESLPTPTRTGYTFEGWYQGYQSPSAIGEKVETGAVFSAGNTITAVWNKDGAEQATSVRIDFYPNGGRISEFNGMQIPAMGIGQPPYTIDDYTGIDLNSGIGWTQTNGDGKLSSIPAAVREGYTFDGWYMLEDTSDFWDIIGNVKYGEAAFTNLTGQKLTTSTINKTDATYAAKWVKAGETFTVTFDLNGATGTAPEPKKVEKGKTVELPVLSAVNAKFLGWGYSTDGETLQEWKAENPVTSDITLYAMWEAESDDLLKGLTYRFENNHEAFGYSYSYVIPLERYQMVFGKIQGGAFYNGRTWGGSCYGMAATSGMFFHGNGTTTTASFRSGANVPYDLFVTDRNSSLNMTLTEYIEAVFVSQYADAIQDDYSKTANLNSLAQSAEAVQDTKSPVMIAIRGEAFTQDGRSVNSGHAVLGYDVVEVSSTESRLMIYDPNFPNTERYITLTKSGNNYVSWAYRLNDMYDWGTGKRYSKIGVVPYSDYSQVWNNRAVRSNNPALFSTNATNASILDNTGAIVATIKNGTISASSSDITPILTYGVTSNGTVPDNDTSAMWLPVGQYTIQTTDSSIKEFEATLADVNQSATVSTSASSVTFAVNDDKALNYVQIDQAGVKYDITLSSTLDQGHDDVQLTGTTASGGVSFAQISGILYGEGVDSGAALKVDGKSAAISSLSSNMPDIENPSASTPSLLIPTQLLQTHLSM